MKKEPPATISPEVERLFGDHHGLVFRTAYRITGNAADAEDVLQTVFLRLLRVPGLPERPESYLRRAAVNVSLDIVRARRETAALEHSPAAPPDAGALREALRRALAKLKPRWAEIFILRFVEGWTNGEIAAALGMSPVLVAVTVHRARRQLQNEMKSQW